METQQKYKLFQVPSTLSKISTMSNWLRIQFDTQETLSSDDYKRLFELNNKIGWLSFNVNMIEFEDVLNLPAITPKNGQKSHSKRLRDVLYRLWEQGSQDKTSDEYYEQYMEFLIDKVKDKLND